MFSGYQIHQLQLADGFWVGLSGAFSSLIWVLSFAHSVLALLSLDRTLALYFHPYSLSSLLWESMRISFSVFRRSLGSLYLGGCQCLLLRLTLACMLFRMGTLLLGRQLCPAPSRGAVLRCAVLFPATWCLHVEDSLLPLSQVQPWVLLFVFLAVIYVINVLHMGRIGNTRIFPVSTEMLVPQCAAVINYSIWIFLIILFFKQGFTLQPRLALSSLWSPS